MKIVVQIRPGLIARIEECLQHLEETEWAETELAEKGGWRKALAMGLAGASMMGGPMKAHAQEVPCATPVSAAQTAATSSNLFRATFYVRDKQGLHGPKADRRVPYEIKLSAASKEDAQRAILQDYPNAVAPDIEPEEVAAAAEQQEGEWRKQHPEFGAPQATPTAEPYEVGPGHPSAKTLAIQNYEETVRKAIGEKWMASVKEKDNLISPGQITMAFYVNADGEVEDIRIIRNTSNETLASISVEAIMDAALPAVSHELHSILGKRRMPFTMNFNIDGGPAREQGQTAKQQKDEWDPAALAAFKEGYARGRATPEIKGTLNDEMERQLQQAHLGDQYGPAFRMGFVKGYLERHPMPE